MSHKILSYQYPKARQTDFIIDDDINLQWLKEFPSAEFDRFVVFYDENIKSLWVDKILEVLQSHQKKIVLIPLAASEDTKSLHYYPTLIETMQEHYCSKLDLAIAIGGGTIIDLVMFTASTYMRGMPVMLIPTTLVGQVDAATAGKTCLNTSKVKNQLGTFYYPRMVYNNVQFLKTNEYYYFRQGLSEVLKYGLLDSMQIIKELQKYETIQDTNWLLNIVELTIQSRVKICQIDASASNLGHTFGHAIEKITNYEVLHGDAINVGTVMALSYSVEIGLIPSQLLDDVVDMMKKLGFNLYVDPSWDAEEFVNLMRRDKKSSLSELNLILIKGVAEPYEHNSLRFYKAAPESVKQFVDRFLREYAYSQHDYLGRINTNQIEYNI